LINGFSNMPSKPLDVELRFRRLSAAESATTRASAHEVYDVTLLDHFYASAKIAMKSVVLLPDETIPEIRLTPREFVDRFSLPGELTLADGRGFGQWLENWLFPRQDNPQSDQPSNLRTVWDRIIERTRQPGDPRPLRLLVAFPEAQEEEGLLRDLPFELLARDMEFLFRKPRWSLVRCFQGTDGVACELTQARLGVIWANTADERGRRLSDAIFQGHESALQFEADPQKFSVVEPLQRATVAGLQKFIDRYEGSGLEVASIVAHGAPGMVWFHKDAHPDYPQDPGNPLSAAELANELSRAKVQIALLWCCYAARGHSVLGSVARSLVTQGRLAGVIAAHAALRADTTPILARTLFQKLVTTAQGQFDLALGEARRALSEGDLQWAALLFYARPDRGRYPGLIFEPALDLDLALNPWALANAPPSIAHFVGRSDEITRGLELVVSSRLVTLTGLPGVGKSELARVIADRLADFGERPIDGAAWISMAGMTRSSDLRARVAAAFDLRDVDDDAALAHKLAARRELLILDNAEDLIGADRRGFQQLVGTILGTAAGVRFLLTSRQLLGNPEPAFYEHALPLDCLPAAHAHELFISAAEARLAPDEAQSDECRQLVDMLAGHPRSLVLVAGQVGRGLSLNDIRRRLERDTVDAVVVHELIGAGAVDADAELRAKRLVSSLNLAFAALEDENAKAAELFCWLGALPGGLPSALVPAVFGERSEELVVVVLRHSLAVVVGPDRRLSLPAPLRWFARQKLLELPGEPQVVFEALASALGEWLVFHYQRCLGTDATRRAIRVAAEETDNLDELAGELMRRFQSAPACAALARGMGAWSAIESYAGRAATAAVCLQDWAGQVGRVGQAASARAVMLGALGDLQVRTARLREAEESYRAALPIYREIEARLGEANTLRALGDLQVRTARLREAEESYRAALPIYREIEDRLGEANTLKALGDLQVRTDRLREAEESYRAALPIYREIEARLGEANTLRALGDLQVRTDRLREAEESYRAALSIYREIEARLGEANTLQGLGNLSLALGHAPAAFEQYREALVINETIDNRLGVAASLGYMARAALHANDASRTVVLGYFTSEILRELDDEFGQGLVLADAAQAFARLNDFESALAAYYLSWAHRKRIGDPGTDKLEGMLKQAMMGFDAASVDEAIAKVCRDRVLAAATEQSGRLKEAGIQMLDPLPSSGEQETTGEQELTT
jgi:tetratricopeptide (TPR) repeat protein